MVIDMILPKLSTFIMSNRPMNPVHSYPPPVRTPAAYPYPVFSISISPMPPTSVVTGLGVTRAGNYKMSFRHLFRFDSTVRFDDLVEKYNGCAIPINTWA